MLRFVRFSANRWRWSFCLALQQQHFGFYETLQWNEMNFNFLAVWNVVISGDFKRFMIMHYTILVWIRNTARHFQLDMRRYFWMHEKICFKWEREIYCVLYLENLLKSPYLCLLFFMSISFLIRLQRNSSHRIITYYYMNQTFLAPFFLRRTRKPGQSTSM